MLCLALFTVLIPPVQASAGPQWKCPELHSMFRKHGLPVPVFDRLAWRESRCVVDIVSKPNGDGSVDIGALQINSSWRTLTARTCNRPFRQVVKSLRVLSCNLKVAAVLWDGGKGASNWRVSSQK